MSPLPPELSLQWAHPSALPFPTNKPSSHSCCNFFQTSQGLGMKFSSTMLASTWRIHIWSLHTDVSITWDTRSRRHQHIPGSSQSWSQLRGLQRRLELSAWVWKRDIFHLTKPFKEAGPQYRIVSLGALTFIWVRMRMEHGPAPEGEVKEGAVNKSLAGSELGG